MLLVSVLRKMQTIPNPETILRRKRFVSRLGKNRLLRRLQRKRARRKAGVGRSVGSKPQSYLSHGLYGR